MIFNQSNNHYDTDKLDISYKPLFEFFVDGIKDIYWAEKAIEEQLKKIKSMAHDEQLVEAIEDHELMTHKHSLRLEKVFQLLKMKPEAKKCDAMAGILKEGTECIEKTPANSATRDAVIIICAQKVEHYEIASYGGLVQIALTLNLDKIADLLDRTLEEEEDTDALLTDIAEESINFEAAQEGDDAENDQKESKSESPSSNSTNAEADPSSNTKKVSSKS